MTEFEVKSVEKIEKKTLEGIDIFYRYRLVSEAEDAVVSVKSSKKLKMVEGETINLELVGKQTKIE